MAKKDISNDVLYEVGRVMLVQNNQQKQVQDSLVGLQSGINKLSNINDGNLDDLDSLLKMAESMCLDRGIDIDNVDYNMDNEEFDLCKLTQGEKDSIKSVEFNNIDTVEINDETSWDEYINNVERYALSNNVDLSKEPFEELL